MSEEIEVTKILIKIRKEEVISLTVAEARKLQKVLDNVLGKPKDDPQPYPDTTLCHIALLTLPASPINPISPGGLLGARV